MNILNPIFISHLFKSREGAYRSKTRGKVGWWLSQPTQLLKLPCQSPLGSLTNLTQSTDANGIPTMCQELNEDGIPAFMGLQFLVVEHQQENNIIHQRWLEFWRKMGKGGLKVAGARREDVILQKVAREGITDNVTCEERILHQLREWVMLLAKGRSFQAERTWSERQWGESMHSILEEQQAGQHGYNKQNQFRKFTRGKQSLASLGILNEMKPLESLKL